MDFPIKETKLETGYTLPMTSQPLIAMINKSDCISSVLPVSKTM